MRHDTKSEDTNRHHSAVRFYVVLGSIPLDTYGTGSKKTWCAGDGDESESCIHPMIILIGVQENSGWMV